MVSQVARNKNKRRCKATISSILKESLVSKIFAQQTLVAIVPPKMTCEADPYHCLQVNILTMIIEKVFSGKVAFPNICTFI